MVKVLIAVSSVGLGHIARSRPLGLLLHKIYGFKVHYLAPPPTDAYLRSYGVNPLSVSSKLRSLSTIVDEYYSLKGTARISLGMILKEYRVVRRNRAVIDDVIDYDDYDVIIADESWELLDSDKFLRKSGTKKVFMTDFLKYPYIRLRDVAGASLFNRFLWKRLKFFDLILYVGFPEKVPNEKGYTGIDVVGPIPPMLEDEVLSENEARSLIKSSNPTILVSLGGTIAGIDIMRMVCRIMGNSEFSIYMAPGASIDKSKIGGCTTINNSLKFKIPIMIRAFNVIVALSGLSSLAASIVEGIPTITIPLPQHFEQEENAVLASRKYSWITSIKPSEYTRIPEIVKKNMTKPSSGDKSLYKNQFRIALAIKDMIN